LSNLNVKLNKEQKITSVFKSNSHRFKEGWEEKPGPGQYDIANTSLTQSRSHPTFSHSYPVNPKLTVPSIPIDNLGFKEDENNQMKKVIPETDSLGDLSNPQSTFNSKGVVPWKPEKMMKR